MGESSNGLSKLGAGTARYKLSAQDLRVLCGCASGDTIKAIAVDLGMTERTVKRHRANILRKMGVQNLCQAFAGLYLEVAG